MLSALLVAVLATTPGPAAKQTMQQRYLRSARGRVLEVCRASGCNSLQGSLGESLTFTRPSAWTCPNDDGSITQLASGVPCTPKGGGGTAYGVKVRPSVVTMDQRSAAIGTSPWSLSANTTAPASSTLSPDGTSDANDITEGSTASAAYYAFQVITASANTTYTWSVYAVPSATNTYLGLDCAGNVSLDHAIWFNMSTGATSGALGGGTGVFKAAPGPGANGFNRYTLTFTTGNTDANVTCYVGPSTSGTSFAHAGTVGAKTTVWQEQLESGSTASDPCLSAGASAICAAESLQVASVVAASPEPSVSADFIDNIGSTTSNEYVQLMENSGADYWGSYLSGSHTFCCGNQAVNVCSAAAVTTGTQHHGICRYDKAGGKFWGCLDGACLSTAAASAPSATYTATVGYNNLGTRASGATIGSGCWGVVGAACP